MQIEGLAHIILINSTARKEKNFRLTDTPIGAGVCRYSSPFQSISCGGQLQSVIPAERLLLQTRATLPYSRTAPIRVLYI